MTIENVNTRIRAMQLYAEEYYKYYKRFNKITNARLKKQK